MTKLTLSVDEGTLAKAKKLAKNNDTSVSAMFSMFVESMAEPGSRRPRIGPITRRAIGIAKLPRGKTDRELLAEALAERYGLDE